MVTDSMFRRFFVDFSIFSAIAPPPPRGSTSPRRRAAAGVGAPSARDDCPRRGSIWGCRRGWRPPSACYGTRSARTPMQKTTTSALLGPKDGSESAQHRPKTAARWPQPSPRRPIETTEAPRCPQEILETPSSLQEAPKDAPGGQAENALSQLSSSGGWLWGPGPPRTDPGRRTGQDGTVASTLVPATGAIPVATPVAGTPFPATGLLPLPRLHRDSS